MSQDGRMNSYLVLLASGLKASERNVIVSSEPGARQPVLSRGWRGSVSPAPGHPGVFLQVGGSGKWGVSFQLGTTP